MRFAGTCEPLGQADVADLVSWITNIDFAEWPQQHKLPDGQLRPSMISDLEWHKFGLTTDKLVADLIRTYFTGSEPYQRMLSVVMPGHSIEPHKDCQASYWRCRVHVPLTSNDKSSFIVGGVAHQLVPGNVYQVNTEAEHSVVNNGSAPRIHFMFDVKQ